MPVPTGAVASRSRVKKPIGNPFRATPFLQNDDNGRPSRRRNILAGFATIKGVYACSAPNKRGKLANMNAERAYQELLHRVKEARLLESVGSLLGWDERTYLPPRGAVHRADQMALIARLTH